MRLFVTLSLCGACAAGTAAQVPSASAGGDLDATERPVRTVEVHGDTLSVWAAMQVPKGSRLPTALAAVDAMARTELLKLVQVQVVSMQTDQAANGEQHLETIDLERVQGRLAEAVTLRHGWAPMLTDDNVLFLASRLDISRPDLVRLMSGVMTGQDAQALVSRLFARSAQ